MKKLIKYGIIVLLLISYSFANEEGNNISSAQNYPNPFNLQTTIQFQLKADSEISIKIYNILGTEIKTLFDNEFISAGAHKIVWDGRDNNNQVIPSGMYLFQIRSGNEIITKKMSLLK